MKEHFRPSALTAMALAAFAFGGFQVQAGDAAVTRAPTVLELFTSQGCSSCPPADALLGRYVTQPGVIALSYSVDYWDYLGWHDTLASPANSARQRAYAKARGDGDVYTPQIVIDGMHHAVGSDAARIKSVIRSTQAALAGSQVPVGIVRNGAGLKITLGPAPAGSKARHAKVLVAVVTNDVTVPIRRGENRGRNIAYHHVVRSLTPVGTWTGAAKALSVPLAKLKRGRGDFYVALLQEAGPGPILGAAETAPQR